jgi:hypothetical protein
MKVYRVIKDDILTDPHFTVRSVRMYLYHLEGGFECA